MSRDWQRKEKDRSKSKPSSTPVRTGLLQRKCACGGNPGVDGECEECRSKRLITQPPAADVQSTQNIQKKLTVNQPGDRYEQEADRVANQVMLMPVPGAVQAKEIQRQPVNNEEDEELRRQPTEDEEDERSLQAKEVPGQVPRITPELQTRIDSLRGEGQPLPESTRVFMETRFGHDFSRVRIHADTQATETAKAIKAQAFTLGQDVVFGAGQYSPLTSSGQHLLAHELAHVVQQNKMDHESSPKAVQRRISVEDVSSEMVGQSFLVRGSLTTGPVNLAGGERVVVLSWSNTAITAHVQLSPPHIQARIPFDIPKQLLLPARPGTAGVALYSAGIRQVERDFERGEEAITREETRKGGPRPGEVSRLHGLQVNREWLLNRRLIQETMFNRFDPIIRHWTDHYNQQFNFKGTNALDPNLVKSLFFQESQMGTSGEHLEEPPSHPVRSRFNIGQAIDSSGMELLIMMREEQPALITTYHLSTISRDLDAAQQELKTLQRARHRNAAQEARLSELTRLSQRNWEFFLWEYKASGQTRGFNDAVMDYFAHVSPGQPHLNLDYEFWIRTAIRWLFEKRLSLKLKSWGEAIRAYNGSGAKAQHYRQAVERRASAATAAQRAGREFIPGGQ
jgi:Domain of unknown function (DUF4157)